jgi:hypothetical protein
MLAAAGRFIAATAWFLHTGSLLSVHTKVLEEKNGKI